MMPFPIKSIAEVEREAREAAYRYDSLEDACPYPFNADIGQVFKKEFLRKREAIAASYAGREISEK